MGAVFALAACTCKKPSHVSGLELAAPFIIGAVVIVLSVALSNLVVDKLTRHFERGWTPEELREARGRHPERYAVQAVWAIDAAQILPVLATPLLGLLLLRNHYSTGLLVYFIAAAVFVVVAGLYMIDQVDIDKYPAKGWDPLGVRVTRVAAAGIVLNGLGVLLSAFVLK
jgi:hypothetical protein